MANLFNVRENRSYGINYTVFTGILSDCFNCKAEMERMGNTNGNGDLFSYDVMVEMDDETGCLIYPCQTEEGLLMVKCWAPMNACCKHVFVSPDKLESFIEDLFQGERIPDCSNLCGEYWCY